MLMKSPFAKFRNSDEALETALRDYTPESEFPPELHHSIMRAVKAANREGTQISGSTRFQAFVNAYWLPATGFAGLVLLGVLISIHSRPIATSQNPQPLAEISNAFARGQELMDSLPSVTVGPLSDELVKMNRDLDRTAEFLIATLP